MNVTQKWKNVSEFVALRKERFYTLLPKSDTIRTVT
jgi:hypothetical protein